MARLAQAPQRRANFVEEKTLAALTVPLRSEGRLEYRRPDHLEKITTAPQYESLVVEGGRLVIAAGGDPPRVVELDGPAGNPHPGGHHPRRPVRRPGPAAAAATT